MSDHIFDKAKWQSLTIFEQMGNIGSEVGRALSAKRRGDDVAMQGAFYRGLDLIDATVEKLARDKSPQLGEVLRAREEFAKSLEVTDNKLESYFMNYAIATRINR